MSIDPTIPRSRTAGPAAPAGLSDAAVRGLAAVAALACLLPVAAVDVLPLHDLPNHLARVRMLAGLDAVPVFAEHYDRHSLVLPNVLSDLVLLALMQAADPMTAGRLLVGGIVAATVAGGAVLSRTAAGRWSAWTLLPALLAMHEFLMWGFLNYLLGLALLPWALAVWLALDRRTGSRVAAGAAAGVILFLSHLVAFGLFAVAVAVLELRRAWLARADGLGAAAARTAVSATAFAPAILLWALSPSSGLPADPLFAYDAWNKLAPYGRLLSTGNPALDDLATAALVALPLLGLLSRRAALDPGLALVAGAWAGLALVLPYSAMGSYFLDSRIVVAAVLVLVCAVRPRPRPAPAAEGLVAAAVLAVVAVRAVGLAQEWRDEAAAVRPLLAALGRLPPGSVVISGTAFQFELGDYRQTRSRRPPEEHLAAYAVLAADAVVVNVFARPGQNPLAFAPAWPAMWHAGRNPIPRLRSPAERTGFAAEGARIAAEARSAGRDVPVFVVGHGIACAAWPADAPVEPFACDPGFSVMRARPAEGAVR